MGGGEVWKECGRDGEVEGCFQRGVRVVTLVVGDIFSA